MDAHPDSFPRGKFASLLEASDDPRLRSTLVQFAAGLALAALFGLALGTRAGGSSLWEHALFVPAGVCAVLALGIPAYFIGMAIIDAPLSPHALLSSSGAAVAATGAVLGGLAPATALYVITTQSNGTASFISLAALTIGGVFGLRSLLKSNNQRLRSADGGKQIFGLLISSTFVIFATIFAARFWFTTLPILGGA